MKLRITGNTDKKYITYSLSAANENILTTLNTTGMLYSAHFRLLTAQRRSHVYNIVT